VFKVTCEGQVIEVPLVARQPKPDVQLDSFVDFGKVVLDRETGCAEKEICVRMVNTGVVGTQFKATYSVSLPVTITPAKGFIAAAGEPGSTLDLFLKYSPRLHGTFRALAQVELDGQAPCVLDLNAEVVAQSLEMIFPNGGGEATAIPFGSLYQGHTRTVSTLLINNGPEPCHFAVALAHADSTQSSSPSSAKVEEVVAEPRDGTIEPYGNMQVDFTYAPKASQVLKGYATIVPPQIPPQTDSPSASTSAS
jgi:hypothetical protein